MGYLLYNAKAVAKMVSVAIYKPTTAGSKAQSAKAISEAVVLAAHMDLVERLHYWIQAESIHSEYFEEWAHAVGANDPDDLISLASGSRANAARLGIGFLGESMHSNYAPQIEIDTQTNDATAAGRPTKSSHISPSHLFMQRPPSWRNAAFRFTTPSSSDSKPRSFVLDSGAEVAPSVWIECPSVPSVSDPTNGIRVVNLSVIGKAFAAHIPHTTRSTAACNDPVEGVHGPMVCVGAFAWSQAVRQQAMIDGKQPAARLANSAASISAAAQRGVSSTHRGGRVLPLYFAQLPTRIFYGHWEDRVLTLYLSTNTHSTALFASF